MNVYDHTLECSKQIYMYIYYVLYVYIYIYIIIIIIIIQSDLAIVWVKEEAEVIKSFTHL